MPGVVPGKFPCPSGGVCWGGVRWRGWRPKVLKPDGLACLSPAVGLRHGVTFRASISYLEMGCLTFLGPSK